MKKVLVTVIVIVINSMAIGDLCIAADAPDIVIKGDVHQVCVAKENGVCNQYLTKREYHTHRQNISVHGDVAQLCSAKTGGQCNIDGRSYGSDKSCFKYEDGYVWCT